MNPPTDPLPDQVLPARKPTDVALLCIVTAALFAGLLIYAQLHAFSWDEGFHLLAASLIRSGQKPYLDFCFPQTPLNAYWNAAWMQLFGVSWRVTHTVATALTASAIFLTADFILARFPIQRWRLAGALAAAFLVGLNGSIVLFGTIAQAYAFCLFLTVAAFRVALRAVENQGSTMSALAGLLVCAAAASSLLTAPAAPVLLAWILFYNRNGNRWTKSAAFLAGGAIPFLPVLWLLIQSPHQVFFNLIGYQVFFRRSQWQGATTHDLDVLTSWVDSGQALLLGLLAIAGLLFIVKRSGWDRARRSEFYLCAWLAAAMGLEIATAHPTFRWYFLLIVPFLAIPAVAGLYELASRMYSPDRPLWPVTVLTLLLALGLSRALADDSDSTSWHDMEAIAHKVQEVTPPNGALWAGEQIYFLTRRSPPDGMEFQAAQKMDMPMPAAAALHVLPHAELDRRVKAGAFDTIEICDDDRIKELGLADLYSKSVEISGCSVFWEKK
jgi:4-amino-4-deoxy-L-arabinose transferase-like glycosyltransferase